MPKDKEDQSFEEKVLDGIETVETQQATLVKNYDQLDKDTKKAFEELTKVKETCNSLTENVSAIQKVSLQMKREQRMAFGDPLQRILNNEEQCCRINLLLRLIAAGMGDAGIPVKDLQERFKGITGKALGEDSSPGSTLIDDALAKEIYDTLQSFGKWATLGVRRLSTKQTKYPVKTARPVANFVLTEAGTIADDTTKAGTSVTLEVEVIAVLLNVALQLLQDSEFDVTADVMNDFIEAYNLRLDVAAFTADGTADATNGGMTGLFNFGTAAVAGAGNTLVENMQLDDFVRCLTTVDSAVLSRQAKWWAHPQILARALLVRDANGRSIFLTATEAPTRSGIGSMLGYPVEMVEAAPSTNAANKKVMAFGDPQSLVVGVRTDFAFEASDHFRWNTLERSFRAYGRAGTKGRRATGSAILTTAAV
jgi:HK97 family phage major capsid protein